MWKPMYCGFIYVNKMYDNNSTKDGMEELKLNCCKLYTHTHTYTYM